MPPPAPGSHLPCGTMCNPPNCVVYGIHCTGGGRAEQYSMYQGCDRGHHGTSGAGCTYMSTIYMSTYEQKVLFVPSQQLELAQMLCKGLGNAELQGVVVNICGPCQELLMMCSQPIKVCTNRNTLDHYARHKITKATFNFFSLSQSLLCKPASAQTFSGDSGK